MATAAKATGYLELNITGFDQALKTAKNLMVAFAAGFSAYKIADFFKDGIKGAVDFGKEMQSASRAMGGFDPGSLLLGQKALEKMGMGAEEARGHIGDFISQGRHISEIFGGSDNYARALKSAAADYGSQASVLSRSGEKLQSVWNTMESVGSKVKTFFLTATEQFVLPLQTALDFLNTIDLAGIGESFGKSIAKAATMLMGVFKNGDMVETLKLGITLAFQEGINYLAGGIIYVSNNAKTQFLNGFIYAMNGLEGAWNSIFSNVATYKIIENGFIGIASKFSQALLTGLNLAMKLSGIGTVVSLVGKARGGSGDIIPKSFIDGIGKDGDNALKEASGMVNQYAASLFKIRDNESFQKANVFDTSETGKKLQELLTKGTSTGEAMNNDSRAKHSGDEKGARQALTSFSGSSSRVIADSLAKVGGGGNFLKVGMSLQERTQMQIARSTRETAEATKALAHDSKNKPTKSNTLGRGN